MLKLSVSYKLQQLMLPFTPLNIPTSQYWLATTIRMWRNELTGVGGTAVGFTLDRAVPTRPSYRKHDWTQTTHYMFVACVRCPQGSL